MIIFQVKNFVAGNHFDFMNFHLFITGCLISLPFASVISLLFIIFNSIRHEYSFLQVFIPYFIFVLLAWGLIIPFSSYMVPNIVDKFSDDLGVSTPLSKGYFRAMKNMNHVEFFMLFSAGLTIVLLKQTWMSLAGFLSISDRTRWEALTRMSATLPDL